MNTTSQKADSIRWMIRRDMPEVLQIERVSFEFPWSEEDFVRCLRQRNCIAMVFENKKTKAIEGFIVYELHRNRLHILSMAVRFPGHGVGRRLLQKLVSKLSPNRRNKIMCEVRESNLNALQFFRHLGFKCISILRDFYTEHTTEDAFLMQYRYVAEPVNDACFTKENRMGWREKKIDELEVADGFITTLKTKHKIATLGDLADRWTQDQLGFLLPKPGASAVALLRGELARISHGEVGGEEEAPSTVKFQQPPNGNGHAKGNGEVTGLPPGSRMGTKEELKEFIGQNSESLAPVADSLPAEVSADVGIVVGGMINVPAAEWERMQKLVGRVKDVEEKSNQVQQAKAKYAAAKDSSLAAKKNYDEATNELLDMIAGQLRLNFDDEPEKAKPAKEEKASTRKKKGDEVLDELRSEPAAPDAWRAAPLTVLPTVAADKKLATRLAKGGLKTIGNLQDVRSKILEWPKCSEDTKDKLQVEADVWLSKNRDAAVFAGANAQAAEREKEFPKQVELTKDILDAAHGNAVLVKAGTIMDAVKCNDGSVGVGVGGIVMQLDAEEWRPVVKTMLRAKTILLVKDVPGFANEEDRMKAGAEFEVIGWSGECPLVKTEAGRETSVAPSEFQVLGDLTEWPVDEVA